MDNRGIYSPQPIIHISRAPTYINEPQYDGRTEGALPGTSHLLGALPANEYTYRAPSPPHIHIPQAPEDKVLVLPKYYDFQCKPQCREVLTHITQNSNDPIIRKDWKYEWRRKAQAISRFLYLGPSSAARDVETIRAAGITMLLVIRDTSMAQAKFLSGDKVAKELSIGSDAIDVAGNTQLIAAFPRAIEKINDHLMQVFERSVFKDGTSANDPATVGKVLVFCESGNERSAAVVAAYLMHMYNLDEVEAIQYLQAQRFCVAFDDGLKHLLRSYNGILQARNSVGEPNIRPPSTSGGKPKRGHDAIDEDMDVDPERQDDEERFGKRSGFTPFRDLTMSG